MILVKIKRFYFFLCSKNANSNSDLSLSDKFFQACLNLYDTYKTKSFSWEDIVSQVIDANPDFSLIKVYDSKKLKKKDFFELDPEPSLVINIQTLRKKINIMSKKRSFFDVPLKKTSVKMLTQVADLEGVTIDIFFRIRSWQLFIRDSQQHKFHLMHRCVLAVAIFIKDQLPDNVKSLEYKNVSNIRWPKSGKISFLWKEFLDSFKQASDFASLSSAQKFELQEAFFQSFVEGHSFFLFKSPLDKDCSTYIKLAPNCAVYFSEDVTFETIFIKKIPFHASLRIVVEFGFSFQISVRSELLDKLTAEEKLKRESDFNNYKIRKLQLIEKSQRRHVPIHLYKNLKKVLIKLGLIGKGQNDKFFDALLSIIYELNASVFGTRSFTYEAFYLDFVSFCELVGLKKSFEDSQYEEVEQFLIRIKKFLSLTGLATIIYPLNLRSLKKELKNGAKDFVFVCVYMEALDSWSFLSESNLFKANINSLLRKELINTSEAYKTLKTVVQTKPYASRENILTLAFGPINVLDLKEEFPFDGEIYQNKFGVVFERKLVELEETYIAFNEQCTNQRLTVFSFQKINSALEKLKCALMPTKKALLKLDFQKLLEQKESSDLCYNYSEKIQINYLNALNSYFREVNTSISDDPLNLACVITFFQRKFERFKKFSASKSKDRKPAEWFNKRYFFNLLFPYGYYFTFLRSENSIRGKDNNKSLVHNYTRIEEQRINKPGDTSYIYTSLITCKSNFRKSFQYNVGSILFPSDYAKARVLDIDLVSLHANFVFCFVDQDIKISWDQEFNKLECWLESDRNLNYTRGFLVKIGINRKLIKAHLLAILNGRSPKTSLEIFEEFNIIYRSKINADGGSVYENLFYSIHTYFLQACEFVTHALKARKKINDLQFFIGQRIPNGFDEKTKVNIILQTLESLLSIALVCDVLEHGFILHSVERDGLVVFGTDQSCAQLSYNTFDRLNSLLFKSRIAVATRLLVKSGDLGLSSNGFTLIREKELSNSDINLKASEMISKISDNPLDSPQITDNNDSFTWENNFAVNVDNDISVRKPNISGKFAVYPSIEVMENNPPIAYLDHIRSLHRTEVIDFSVGLVERVRNKGVVYLSENTWVFDGAKWFLASKNLVLDTANDISSIKISDNSQFIPSFGNTPSSDFEESNWAELFEYIDF